MKRQLVDRGVVTLKRNSEGKLHSHLLETLESKVIAIIDEATDTELPPYCEKSAVLNEGLTKFIPKKSYRYFIRGFDTEYEFVGNKIYVRELE